MLCFLRRLPRTPRRSTLSAATYPRPPSSPLPPPAGRRPRTRGVPRRAARAAACWVRARDARALEVHVPGAVGRALRRRRPSPGQEGWAVAQGLVVRLEETCSVLRPARDPSSHPPLYL